MLLIATVVSGWRNDTNALPTVLVVVGAAAAHAVGRQTSQGEEGLVTLWVVAAAAVTSIAIWPAVLSGTALAPPTHYGNANGSLLAAGAVAAMGAALLHRPGRWRAVAVLIAAALLAGTFATRSVAAAVAATGVALLVAACVTAPVRHLRAAAVSLLVVATAGVFAVTLVLGLPVRGVMNLSPTSHVVAQLTARRVLLWHDAVTITRGAPVSGVGPGRFPEVSYIAQLDADTRQAHSLPLQTAAESGLPGAVGVLAVLVGIVGTAVTRARRRLVVVATGAVCVFAAQSFVDYTYRYPAVVLCWALLTGVLVGVPRSSNAASRSAPSDGTAAIL
jgi:O-antigen ligase